MLNFICGRSGSGKTKRIIDMIGTRVGEGARTLLLVPEQQAFISESMLSHLPPSSALCFEVISFSRLADIVFSKYGGVTDAAGGKGERDVIMWQALRETSTMLREYGGVKTDPALSSMMLSTIDELHASGISAEECERAALECSDARLSGKLHDVALIYANFDRILSERLGEGAFAAENKLSRLLSLLRQHSELFKGCHVFIDSFTSFTGEERAILFELALQADTFTITFCRDSESRGMPHTVSIDDTYRRFLRFAKENELKYSTVTLDAADSLRDAALAYLERGLWDFSLTKGDVKPFSAQELSHIEAYNCKNEFDEINLVALKILEAYHRGVKFSEMAVILRDAESRKGLFEAVFAKMGIPYFISERTDVSATAAARLLFSALRCVIYNFRSVDVLTLLKTGLCGVEDCDSDLFEDYVFTWSISGNRFLEERWSMNPDGYSADKPEGRSKQILISANRVRERLIPPLMTLRDKMAAAKGDTTSLCRALYDYLDEIGLSEALSDLAALDLSMGDVRGAGEDLRIYDCLVSSLSRIATLLSDVTLTPEELLYSIEIMLRGSDVGSVPAVGEYVTLGSAPTLRVENVKIAFVLGLCEGEFPRSYSDSGVFTENDKEVLESLSISLASRETKISSDELFYVYRAMTKPRERLIVSSCSSSIGGGSRTPSTAWNRLFFLFPELKAYHFDLDLVRRIADAVSLGSSESVEKVTDEQIRQELEKSNITVNDEVIISPLQIKMLFGNRLYLSQTKISTFASCPYQYWCRYVLSLRERKVSAVSYDSSGTIVHYVLEKLIGDIKSDDGSLVPPDDESLVEMVNSYVESYVSEIGCELNSSMMYTFSRLRDLALVMAKDVLNEFSDSSFKVLAQEMRISDSREGALKPLEISVDESDSDSPKIVLGGIIDRLDFYDGDDRRYLRVVDYKTGHHPFDLDGLENGKDVQLPAYLFTAALEENKEVIGGEKEIFPASALFLSANESGGEVSPERSGFMLGDPDLFRAASASLDKKMLAGIDVDRETCLAKRGNAVSEEEIKDIEASLRDSIAETGRSIYSGYAPKTPSKDACKYCFLKSSCPVAAKNTDF